jgi:hypothetical protein
MKLKSILLAAAGLLALAGAVDSPVSPQEVVKGVATTPSATIAAGEDISVDARYPTPCQLNCDLPWKKCVKECGGGSSCEHQCSCELFSNPKEVCRLRSEQYTLVLFGAIR